MQTVNAKLYYLIIFMLFILSSVLMCQIIPQAIKRNKDHPESLKGHKLLL